VKQINDRGSYIDVVIDWAGRFEQSIVLCVDTLDPSRKEEKVKILHEKLQEAQAHGKDAKFIAPGGPERIEAAYEISKVRGIPAKFLTYLGDGDFRFTIVDTNISIISIAEHNIPSKGCIVIKSERLNILLRRYSDELWNRPEAMDYDTFLTEVISSLRDPGHPLSNKSLSERLGLPVSELERISSKLP